MTIQQIVSPEKIESELLRIWETLAKENKTRASLFNLVVFNRLSSRTDYFRNIVQKVTEKFPCRTLFITEDPDTSQVYLKTAISVVVPSPAQSEIACDQIDIGVAGEKIKEVPFLLFPHLIPDLPVYLLWTEDPSIAHPLFQPLSTLATRIIFDSESADNLTLFGQTVLNIREQTQIDIGDLNWARTEGWRNLVTSLFDTSIRLEELSEISSVRIVFNDRTSDFFCHLKIQAMYILYWLASQLKWRYKTENKLVFTFIKQKEIEAKLEASTWPNLGSGTITEIELIANKHFFKAARMAEQYHHVRIQVSSDEACELPYQYVLGHTASGQSLVKEITTKGTSTHYLNMLKILVKDVAQSN